MTLNSSAMMTSSQIAHFSSVSGWMYFDQHGQMCGPYIREQLSSRFLPEVLPVYPSSEEVCWMFEDEEGRKHGPHSLAELLYWHQSSYLRDSVMVYHVEKKFASFTLVTIVDMCSIDGMLKIAEEDTTEDTSSFISFISEISEDVSFQLHSGIMKAARRVFLDEIISSMVPEFFASKKAQRRVMHEEACKDGNIRTHKEPKAMVEMKKSTAIGNKGHDSFHASKESNSSSLVRGESSCRAFMSEDVNNLSDILLAVYQTAHDDSMKVLWNAVIYDPVFDYCKQWLKGKRWSDHADVAITVDEKEIANIDEVQNNDLNSDTHHTYSLGRFMDLRQMR